MPVNDKVARQNADRYTYARDNGHTRYLEKARKCDEYFAGLQWEEAIRRKLESQGRPALTINLTLATIATVMGERIEQGADVTFLPFRNGVDQTAEALAQVYLQIAYANKLQWLEGDVADDGFITSRGFYDVRIGFDDHMKGEVKISYQNPKNVLIDPDAETYDPCGWKEVFVTKWMTADEIETLYNKADADLLRRRSQDDFLFGYDFIDTRPEGFGGSSRFNSPDRETTTRRLYRVLERQHKELRKRRHFVNLVTGDTRPVPDNWDEGRVEKVRQAFGWEIFSKTAEQIKWTITVDNIVLHDEWSPYKHFTIVPYFPFFRRGHTIGLVENLISPQDQVNKASSQELHVVNTTANSGYKVKSGAVLNMEIDEIEQRGAESGVVFEMADMDGLEKLTPNQIPTGLDHIARKSEEHMKSISGVSDSKRGFDRADVAAKAIEAKQAAGSINLAKPMDNLARTRHLVAERVLDLIQTYYTEERVLQVTGGGLSTETSDLSVNQTLPDGSIVNDLTLGEYSVRVTTVPTRETYQQSQFTEALSLRVDAGIRIPDEWLVEHSHLNRKSELIKAIKEQNGGGEPSETELQLAQLEVEAKQVENQLNQARAEKERADAALVAMRAEEVAQKVEQGDNGTGEEEGQGEAELFKVQQEILLARQKQEAELELQRRRVEAELEIMRERARNDSLIRRAEAAERSDIQRQQAEQRTEKRSIQ